MMLPLQDVMVATHQEQQQALDLTFDDTNTTSPAANDAEK